MWLNTAGKYFKQHAMKQSLHLYFQTFFPTNYHHTFQQIPTDGHSLSFPAGQRQVNEILQQLSRISPVEESIPAQIQTRALLLLQHSQRWTHFCPNKILRCEIKQISPLEASVYCFNVARSLLLLATVKEEFIGETAWVVLVLSARGRCLHQNPLHLSSLCLC